MSRLPTYHLPQGKGPRQLIWEAIRLAQHYDVGFSVPDVRANIPMESRDGIALATIRAYLRALEKAGIVTPLLLKTAKKPLALWRLEKDEGIDAPRVKKDGSRITMGARQEQIWRTLRILNRPLTLAELAAHASTDAAPVSQNTAQKYLTALEAAGFVAEEASGRQAGERPAKGKRARLVPTYRLLRFGLPKPPIVCRPLAVFDPNEGGLYLIEPVHEEVTQHDK
ncbi:MAG: hypothetical protein LBS89_06605 [Zoogloeaceae bacterium]|jgi:Fe2+ or Zn2+ uptake regulation protein|nr:hypothetical protein [Zoogloeaceae bacterium]